MRVIAYTYRADYHCPTCAKVDASYDRLKVDNYHPHAVKLADRTSVV